MSTKYKVHDQELPHYVTLTVIDWVDVFTRNEYKDILLQSIRYCQKEKGLIVHAWVLKTNHIHMIISRSRDQYLELILRDMKKFTSSKITCAIENNPTESRKEWMLEIFRKNGIKNPNNQKYQFWIQDSHPIELYSQHVTWQKIDYIHDNPVKSGIVENRGDYLYSSAYAYENNVKCRFLDITFLD